MRSNMTGQSKHKEARPGFIMFELPVMFAGCCLLIAWMLFMMCCYCKAVGSEEVHPTL